MTSSKKSAMVVNVLYWVVAAAAHPLVRLLPTGSGEPPKIFELMIPLLFVGLAFASTYLLSRAWEQPERGR